MKPQCRPSSWLSRIVGATGPLALHARVGDGSETDQRRPKKMNNIRHTIHTIRKTISSPQASRLSRATHTASRSVQSCDSALRPGAIVWLRGSRLPRALAALVSSVVLLGVVLTAATSAFDLGDLNPLPLVTTSPIGSAYAYAAYEAFFFAVGSGVELRHLPASTREALAPYFRDALLDEVRYGASASPLVGDNAMTDCKVIYFPSEFGMVAVIENEEIFSDLYTDRLHLLLHELTHAEQCDRMLGGRVQYAETWFSELGITTLAELALNPASISAESIHDHMPMEVDAEDNADRLYAVIRGYQFVANGVADWTRLVSGSPMTGSIAVGQFGPHLCDQGVPREDLFLAENGKWFISWCGTTDWQEIRSSSTEIDDDYGLAFGDFNGDGITDVFRASGGQWKVSYSGTGPWTKIKDSDTELTDNHGLLVGFFDSDTKADVFRANGTDWLVSYGGTSPWEKLNASQTTTRRLILGRLDADDISDVVLARLPVTCVTPYVNICPRFYRFNNTAPMR